VHPGTWSPSGHLEQDRFLPTTRVAQNRCASNRPVMIGPTGLLPILRQVADTPPRECLSDVNRSAMNWTSCVMMISLQLRSEGLAFLVTIVGSQDFSPVGGLKTSFLQVDAAAGKT
jgi:hypothetical protein